MRKKSNKMKNNDNNCIETTTTNSMLQRSGENVEVVELDLYKTNADKKEDEEVLKWLKTGWNNKESK